jgi:hypothetical protein
MSGRRSESNGVARSPRFVEKGLESLGRGVVAQRRVEPIRSGPPRPAKEKMTMVRTGMTFD